MNRNRIVPTMSLVALALLLGLLWEAGASTSVFVLLGSGAALMVATCVAAEL